MEERAAVAQAIALGVSEPDLAKIMGVSTTSLRHTFKAEIYASDPDRNLQVVQALFEKAVHGKDVRAMIFWLRSRLGWSNEPQLHQQLQQQNSQSSVGEEDAQPIIDVTEAGQIYEALREAGAIPDASPNKVDSTPPDSETNGVSIASDA